MKRLQSTSVSQYYRINTEMIGMDALTVKMYG